MCKDSAASTPEGAICASSCHAALHTQRGADVDLTNHELLASEDPLSAKDQGPSTWLGSRSRRAKHECLLSQRQGDGAGESARKCRRLKMHTPAPGEHAGQKLDWVLQEASAGADLRQRRQVDPEKRSYGVAMLVALKKDYQVSLPTFILSVSLYDRFVDIYAASAAATAESPEHATGEAGAAFPLDITAMGMRHVYAPVSCFLLAVKFTEVFAPRLTDVCLSVNQALEGGASATHEADSNNLSPDNGVAHEINAKDLRLWEMFTWKALGYCLEEFTVLDVLHSLLKRMKTPARQMMEFSAELNLQISVCYGHELRHHSCFDVAVSVLLQAACEQLDPNAAKEQVHQAIPAALITHDTHRCHHHLKLALDHMRATTCSRDENN